MTSALVTLTFPELTGIKNNAALGLINFLCPPQIVARVITISKCNIASTIPLWKHRSRPNIEVKQPRTQLVIT